MEMNKENSQNNHLGRGKKGGKGGLRSRAAAAIFCFIVILFFKKNYRGAEHSQEYQRFTRKHETFSSKGIKEIIKVKKKDTHTTIIDETQTWKIMKNSAKVKDKQNYL